MRGRSAARGGGTAGGDADLDGAKGFPVNAADESGERDAEEGAGARAGDAGEEAFQAHAGVDHDGHGAVGEQGEGGGDERQAGAHHDEHAVATTDAAGGEFGLPGGDLGGEFGEGQREVVDVAGARAAARDLERGGVRLPRGHGGEVAGDVGVIRWHGWRKTSRIGGRRQRKTPRGAGPTRG